MAKTTRVVLTCDLHGDDTDAVATLVVTNGNARYELDVCQEHLDELTAPARRLRQRRSRSTAGAKRRPGKKSTRTTAARRRSRGRQSVDIAEVRQWARAQGYEIGDRGRIPASIVDAFTAKK
jgi:nucleoid-associated protein Lsr2